MASDGLERICEEAMRVGQRIDLSDCPYGETTGPCHFISRPANYYFFLAGFVKTERLKDVLEIGTNYGGSIMSIAKGLHEDDIASGCLVTMDIVLKNSEAFRKYPCIRRIKGDSLEPKVANKAAEFFKAEIDLLYVDSVHEYDHAKKNIDIYTHALNPRYVILDDIRQCEDMRRLWSELVKKFKEDAFDASEVSIRKGAGFGVIKWRA